MAAKTQDVRISPLALATLMTDPATAKHGLGLGRKWTPQDGAKRVRSIARDTIDRFINRTGRTSHAYNVAEARAIVAEAAKASGGSTASVADLRDALTPSAPRKARKAAASPQDATSDAQGPVSE